MIRRTYGCDACGLEWTVTHDSGDEPYPPCPVCTVKAAWRPKPLRIKTNKSRAMDLAQKTAEAMGHSNMKDSTREGESVAMGPAAPTASDNESLMRQTVEAMREVANRSAGTVSPEVQQFLGATGGTLNDPTATLTAPQQLVAQPPANVVDITKTPAYASAKFATQQAKALTGGESPTGMLHKAMKHQPRDPLRAGIMARWRP